MVRPITMPKLGQSEEEAKIVQWLKKEGEAVAKGDILFEIETDKALLEVESFFDGTLLKVVVAEGQKVPVQSIVAFIGEPGEAVPDVAPLVAQPEQKEPPRASRTVQAAPPAPAGQLPRTRAARPAAMEAGPRPEGRPVPPAVEAERPGFLRISPRAAMLA